MPQRRNPKLIDELALEIAAGGSVRKWAADHGIPERTCYGWSGSPGFVELVQSHRRKMTDRVIGQLTGKASKAVRCLERLMEHGAADSVRLGAARAILSELVAIGNWADLEKRFCELEKRMNNAKSDQPA
jgi:hypothetical protein